MQRCIWVKLPVTGEVEGAVIGRLDIERGFFGRWTNKRNPLRHAGDIGRFFLGKVEFQPFIAIVANRQTTARCRWALPLPLPEENRGTRRINDFWAILTQQRVAIRGDERVEGDRMERAVGDDVEAMLAA